MAKLGSIVSIELAADLSTNEASFARDGRPIEKNVAFDLDAIAIESGTI